MKNIDQRLPVVAVPADRRTIDPHEFHVVGEKYLRALVDASNVLPYMIPAMADERMNESILERCDGLFLTGAYSNVEPHHYGGQPSQSGTLHDPARDAVTLPLVRQCLDRGIPLLAVCRGFQEVNVVMGGSLHQSVADVVGFHNHLENKDDPLAVQYGPAHAVSLPANGLLRDLAGSDTVMVNSLHAQGVARLAGGVTVEAIADDGLIEAFCVDDTPGFNLAVQWHPEWKVLENAFSTAIFNAFGQACRQYAREKF